MRLIRGLHNLRAEHHGCVATIGNFDGVHLGHQAVFAELRKVGDALGLPATVITFEPQPLEYFQPEKAPSRLTRLREKLTVIKDAGIDYVLVLPFGRRLATMGAEAFIDEILVKGLGIQHLYVGDDFRFGRARCGDVGLLHEAGHDLGFQVDDLQTVTAGGERISSTRIRKLLVAGDLQAASKLLGRSYTICGRISHGDKRGRTIGFPTLNIQLHRPVSPLRGVYAVKVHGVDDRALPGVANIGNRPTVEGDPRFLLEVHLFDFDRDVYGAHVGVEFVSHIRDEMKFDSFDALREQISMDSQQAIRIHEQK
ncbi:MAG TPA: bifunctional riboflavin kinase/FAD synthetase [Gammaproteobacteria bacterium]|nr:bifunctional riboflavin kinase/FAD synthetase [Gammaproteobacteria bacterium]